MKAIKQLVIYIIFLVSFLNFNGICLDCLNNIELIHKNSIIEISNNETDLISYKNQNNSYIVQIKSNQNISNKKANNHNFFVFDKNLDINFDIFQSFQLEKKLVLNKATSNKVACLKYIIQPQAP